MADLLFYQGREQYGTICLITPATVAGALWVQENVHTESWQWQGESFVCEPRMARDIAEAAAQEGLDIQ